MGNSRPLDGARETRSDRSSAHLRTTAVSLARGAPAERICCVTETASGAPRTTASLHVHRCGSIRRENASHIISI